MLKLHRIIVIPLWFDIAHLALALSLPFVFLQLCSVTMGWCIIPVDQLALPRVLMSSRVQILIAVLSLV